MRFTSLLLLQVCACVCLTKGKDNESRQAHAWTKDLAFIKKKTLKCQGKGDVEACKDSALCTHVKGNAFSSLLLEDDANEDFKLKLSKWIAACAGETT